MLIIVGLGNPGRPYEHTRHNAGFDTLDLLSERFSIPVAKSRCKSLLGEGFIHGEKVALAKPQTYMNDSGQAVAELLHWYKLPIEQMIVIYDDIDLPTGRVRVRASGSAGTHNGMRSIIEWTGSQDFPRVRVGIGRPPHPGMDLKDFVLGRYTGDEHGLMADAFMRGAKAVEHLVKGDMEAAMREANINPTPAQENT